MTDASSGYSQAMKASTISQVSWRKRSGRWSIARSSSTPIRCTKIRRSWASSWARCCSQLTRTGSSLSTATASKKSFVVVSSVTVISASRCTAPAIASTVGAARSELNTPRRSWFTAAMARAARSPIVTSMLPRSSAAGRSRSTDDQGSTMAISIR